MALHARDFLVEANMLEHRFSAHKLAASERSHKGWEAPSCDFPVKVE